MKAIALLCIALAGCATPQKYWYKAGASAQEFEMDKGQCNAQAFSVPGATQNLMQVAIVQNSCMRGKGWTLE